jgi:hypothetical protein
MFVALYVVIVAVAFVIGVGGNCCGEQGIWAVILTLPWSALTVVLLDAINPELIGRIGITALIPGALLNALLIYRVAARRQHRGHPPADSH